MHCVEERRPFGESALWALQRRFFTERGVEAWSDAEVPHYVTSNPSIAGSYADVVFAFLRDQERLSSSDEPLHVCELGAGSGRFAFHFLNRLVRLCDEAGVSSASFRYVLSDVSERTLEFWRAHPRFRPFFENGLLDVALFDVECSERFELQVGGRTILPGTLERAPCVIANYVFDSVPQDLFYVAGGRVEQCRLSLFADRPADGLDIAELIEGLDCRLDREPLGRPPYAEPELADLVNDYARTLDDVYVMFPATALRCVDRLRALSARGLLLLCADKGSHTSPAATGVPRIVRHGSVSLNVNFHAFSELCERRGGIALFADEPHGNINVGALLMTAMPETYREARSTFERRVRDFGPDDYFSVMHHMGRHPGDLSLRELLAYLRLGSYDAATFARCVPRLQELAPQLGDRDRGALASAVDRVWAAYFPIGEPQDLAFELGTLLYEIDEYAEALRFFERSTQLHGAHTGTLYNMALCYDLLGDADRAVHLLADVVEHDPNNADARGRLHELRAVEKRSAEGSVQGE